MKYRFLLLLGWICLTAACAELPPLQSLPGTAGRSPDSISRQTLEQSCRSCFPTGKWQFTHAIEAVAPDGRNVFLMGAMVLTAEPPELQCALMTPEGFVLFDAKYSDDELIVNRAVPPFDKPGFAQGMMADVRLVFFAPPGAVEQIGLLKDENRVCRYKTKDNGTLDTIFKADGSWSIRRYDDSNKPTRTIRATHIKTMPDSTGQPVPLPGTLTLTAHGLLGYKLRMELVEAIPLPAESAQPE